MIERAGGAARRICTPQEVNASGKLILPGVGSFDRGVEHLQSRGLWEPLQEKVSEGTPLLGICLGMQLLCKGSEEGRLPGFGFVDAEVCRFPDEDAARVKVPHMGWNRLQVTRPNPILPADDQEQRFYFVHSYRVVANDAELPIAMASHGRPFVAALQSRNVLGVQFHPEKSHRFGLELFRRLVEWKSAGA
jgi:imidazole glycerol-phosphate synthase subunit HisH